MQKRLEKLQGNLVLDSQEIAHICENIGYAHVEDITGIVVTELTMKHTNQNGWVTDEPCGEYGSVWVTDISRPYSTHAVYVKIYPIYKRNKNGAKVKVCRKGKI